MMLKARFEALLMQMVISSYITSAQLLPGSVTSSGFNSAVELHAYTGLDLVKAIIGPSITTAVLMVDIVLHERDWDGVATPLLLGRNLTVQGDTPNLRIFDTNWVAKKVQLGDGVVLRLRNLVLLRYRLGNHNQAPGMDLLIPCVEGTSATVVGEDSLTVHRVCYPVKTQQQSLQVIHRPGSVPGTQTYRASVPQTGCVNDSSAPPLQRCWLHRGSYDDLAMLGADFNAYNRLQLTGYVIHMLRTTYTCDTLMTDECVSNLTALGCATLTYAQLNPPWRAVPVWRSPPPGTSAGSEPAADPLVAAAPAAASQRSLGPLSAAEQALESESESPQMESPHGLSAAQKGAVAGGVAGGVAVLLLAVMTALVLLRRRRRRKPQPEKPPVDADPAEAVAFSAWWWWWWWGWPPQPLWSSSLLARQDSTKAASNGSPPRRSSAGTSPHDGASQSEAKAAAPGHRLTTAFDTSNTSKAPLPSGAAIVAAAAAAAASSSMYEAGPQAAASAASAAAAVAGLAVRSSAAGKLSGGGASGDGDGACDSDGRDGGGDGGDGRGGKEGVCRLSDAGACNGASAAATAAATCSTCRQRSGTSPETRPEAAVVTPLTPHRPDVNFNVVMRAALPTDSPAAGAPDTATNSRVACACAPASCPAAQLATGSHFPRAASHAAPASAPDFAPASSSSTRIAPSPPPPAASPPGTPPEVTLLPDRVRGKGSYGRVVEGLYQGQQVAVKLMGVGGLMPLPGLYGGHGPRAVPAGAADEDAGAGGVADTGRQGMVSCDSLLRSFGHEVEVLARCNHPNVVRLLAVCVAPPRLCLVMELMDTSLEQLIRAAPGNLLPMNAVLSIAVDIACGLEYLHPTIVHRDLKPANVLVNDPLGPRQVAKLSDFGLARLYCSELRTRNPEAGTPAYMAPECFDVTATSIGFQVDMYALGVLLWVLLTGAQPWEGLNLMRLAFRVTYGQERPPLSAIPPDRRPPKLLRLIQSCWDADPRRRPAAAEAVKELVMVRDLMRRQELQLRTELGQQRPSQPPARPQFRSMAVFGGAVGDDAARAAALAAAAEAHEEHYLMLLRRVRQRQQHSFDSLSSLPSYPRPDSFRMLQPPLQPPPPQQQRNRTYQWRQERELCEQMIQQRLALGQFPRSLLMQQRKQLQQQEEAEEDRHFNSLGGRFCASLDSSWRTALSIRGPEELPSSSLPLSRRREGPGGTAQGLTIESLGA